MSSFWQRKKILLTGGTGFLGGHLQKALRKQGVKASQIIIPRRPQDDLRDKAVCERLVKNVDLVIHLAAKVGGIGFNQARPADLFYDNALMGVQLMEAARRANVKKFVVVGTVCSYPKYTRVPFKEDDLWNGYPEETNAAYGLAKKILLVQAQAYRQQYGFNAIYLIQVNLYGPGDNFDLNSSHVIPALIKKVYDAKKSGKDYIKLWGTGKASREFLYVEDAARGIVMAAEKYDKPAPVNLGSGMEITIKQLAETIMRLMKFKGSIKWDPSKPDGQPRRSLDVSRAQKEFGFKAQTNLEMGLKKTIGWYKQQLKI